VVCCCVLLYEWYEPTLAPPVLAISIEDLKKTAVNQSSHAIEASAAQNAVQCEARMAMTLPSTVIPDKIACALRARVTYHDGLT
jgi:hypothetical protein